MERLLGSATETDLSVALVAAAFYGKPAMIALLLEAGASPNAWITASSGFHSHATALHQAVYSGSFECVQLLVEAGADLLVEDKIYHGTPLGWALHMLEEEKDEELRKRYAAIKTYLQGKEK